MLKDLVSHRAPALAAALAALGAAAGFAGPAQASSVSSPPLTTPTPQQAQTVASPACSSTVSTSEPFAAWGDTSSYWLVPGSRFDGSAPGWTLAGGATVSSLVSEPWDLSGTPGEGLLSLPAGSTATSPSFCVDPSQPTFRFLDAGSPGSRVAVSVVYELASGSTVTAQVGIFNGLQWLPSPTFQTGGQQASQLTGTTNEMAVQYTALSGTSFVSDLFVDPRMHMG